MYIIYYCYLKKISASNQGFGQFMLKKINFISQDIVDLLLDD